MSTSPLATVLVAGGAIAKMRLRDLHRRIAVINPISPDAALRSLRSSADIRIIVVSGGFNSIANIMTIMNESKVRRPRAYKLGVSSKHETRIFFRENGFDDCGYDDLSQRVDAHLELQPA